MTLAMTCMRSGLKVQEIKVSTDNTNDATITSDDIKQFSLGCRAPEDMLHERHGRTSTQGRQF